MIEDENEKEVEEISKLGRQPEDRLEELIQGREELEATIEKLRITEEEKSRTEETELEEIKLQKRIQEELKIEETRVKMRADLERKTKEEERKDAKLDVKVKLLKIEIRLDALLELNQNGDRSIATITGSEIFLPKRVSGAETEISDRRSAIYI